jgi:serine/threonine-protein kinase
MDYFEGITLKKFVLKERNPLNLLKLAYQIAKSLKKLHDINIIHRDLKLENIMVGKMNNILILDFGLAVCTNF